MHWCALHDPCHLGDEEVVTCRVLGAALQLLQRRATAQEEECLATQAQVCLRDVAARW